jgi:2-polyprenyl-3-methyl-5-hydroxy-6-metoxy-1,4-benzoquinol methylase
MSQDENSGSKKNEHTLDAITAYDRVAPSFRDLSQRRRAYLNAVDAEILRRLPAAATSLLDVGAGDGHRALQIARRAGIREVVLMEPSSGMRALIPEGCEVWNTRIEALSDFSSRFDAVLCLWNVLGHVPSAEQRVAALKNLARLCSGRGSIFLDVLHRYNVAECGVGTVLQRVLRDTFLPEEQNGDVPVTWRSGEHEVETQGHVFTTDEMAGLFRQAGLAVKERIVLNYRTGQRRRLPIAGNLLYILRPS